MTQPNELSRGPASTRLRKGTSPLVLSRSTEFIQRARRVTPGFTDSSLHQPAQCPGAFPAYVARAEGAEIVDVDGNRYVDFICGLGANALGNRDPDMERALLRTLADGVLHSLPSAFEVEITEALVNVIPGAQMARFFRTGSDATSTAVQLAQAITGREPILTAGYHNPGRAPCAFDQSSVLEPLSRLTHELPLLYDADEPTVLAAIEGCSAACIVLSVPHNRVLSSGFVWRVRNACTRSGTMMILDEAVTGFRLGLGGAQEFFGVEADLVCLSKALAAGLPLAAIVGPRHYLTELSGLHSSDASSAELLSLAACGAALAVYRRRGYFKYIEELGSRLREGINAAAEAERAPLRVTGYDAMPFFAFHSAPEQHLLLMQRFQSLMATRGVLLRCGLNFICHAHTRNQIEQTVEAARECLNVMNRD